MIELLLKILLFLLGALFGHYLVKLYYKYKSNNQPLLLYSSINVTYDVDDILYHYVNCNQNYSYTNDKNIFKESTETTTANKEDIEFNGKSITKF